MRLAILTGLVGFSVAAAAITTQLAPAREQAPLGRAFVFEPADVVVEAPVIHAEKHGLAAQRKFARSFSFDPVIVSGHPRKQTVLAARPR